VTRTSDVKRVSSSSDMLESCPHISVVIPAYNEERSIGKTIESLIESDYPGLDEVLVVDDGSDDSTSRIAGSYSGVEVIHNTHQGKVVALNTGCKLAKNEYVFTIDADTTVKADALSKIVSEMVRTGASSVAGSLTTPIGCTLGLLQEYEFVTSDFAAWLWQAVGLVVLARGALVCYRKSHLEEVNYFDSDTVTEDLDITLKLLEKGHKSLITKEVLGVTDTPKQLKGVFWQRVRWFTGCLQTYWKHRKMFLKKAYFATLAMFIFNLLMNLLSVWSLYKWFDGSIWLNFNVVVGLTFLGPIVFLCLAYTQKEIRFIKTMLIVPLIPFYVIFLALTWFYVIVNVMIKGEPSRHRAYSSSWNYGYGLRRAGT
jgi:cellulose synthase/poly-beta-1,6-N-acetylglucosamine synthase-like glycosyltransferase